jgi:hypothetical protein
MARNPKLALLYRDSKDALDADHPGRGHVDSDEAVRDRVYKLSPESSRTTMLPTVARP